MNSLLVRVAHRVIRQADAGNLPIRIYGMTYFDENGEYWGNKTQPLIDNGNSRLTARSVKIFADGMPSVTQDWIFPEINFC